jgi:hypothetical protein
MRKEGRISGMMNYIPRDEGERAIDIPPLYYVATRSSFSGVEAVVQYCSTRIYCTRVHITCILEGV